MVRSYAAAICWLICFATATFAASGDSTRILPLGNSITDNGGGDYSYRRFLWHMLRDSGYVVDFVGTLSDGWEGDSVTYDYDTDHEGWSGWTTHDVLQSIESWLGQYTPDVVLLHLGTNDYSYSADSSKTYLRRIIEALRADNPSVVVLLAQIIPLAGWDYVDSINVRVAELAQEEHTAQSPVVLVDHNSGFDTDVDTDDGCHPNESGARKMAGVWFDTLVTVLPDPTDKVGVVSTARKPAVPAGSPGISVDLLGRRISGQIPVLRMPNASSAGMGETRHTRKSKQR